MEDQEVEFVELGNGGFENEHTASNLQGQSRALPQRWLLPPPGGPNNSNGAVGERSARKIRSKTLCTRLKSCEMRAFTPRW